MKWLNEKDAPIVKTELDALNNAVKVVYFTQEHECSFCRETREVLTEIADLSNKVSLDVFDFIADKEKVQHYNVDKIPATIIVDDKGTDYGIRFFGIPAGYEFMSLLHSIKIIGNQSPGLSDTSLETISFLKEPVHLQVFVTPTCPYCPMAVQVAHSLAFANDLIRADMVEASEFPQLTNKYNIMGVPKVIINETGEFEGALPEQLYVAEVIKASKIAVSSVLKTE